ncbi:hypothetical protein PTSG_02390 [Salpingoeca rosetta]|uniref:DUF1907 domain-containing protein n=1 Tax=Salpingoeca rosetta (strain ATCC 50818 / BSB-021) TaxID=946362 RepID=F2U224_SALR5|nr:uncharacterized protein PTSG_02390 [Salpingoeca rosetta]EGD81676.1 hypothetical protein PTSG_02390 [Salpingoeca rosetta]|eukprot:XP_004996880.1 hypothetical protein PTSG_02390 [Salpingoeca rosetta]
MEVKSQVLETPPLEDVAKALETGLKGCFEQASVSVVDCPDLTAEPYHLAAPGISGSTRLVDVGGVPNLMPLVDRSKVYNFKQVAKDIGLPGAFFIGAGAGSSRLAGVNCEMMPNTNIATQEIRSYFAKVRPETGDMVLEHYESNEFGLLGNFLASEGKQGAVLRVEASVRTGDDNFVTCMRQSLQAAFGDKPVGLGGVFVIEAGDAKLHVMVRGVHCAANGDAVGWILRVEHTHCFSQHGQGGHYHYDTTPANVKYVGYFSVAEHIYRVDAPKVTHQIGRD